MGNHTFPSGSPFLIRGNLITLQTLGIYKKCAAHCKPMDSAAERPAGILETNVKQTESDVVPRRATQKRPDSGHN